VEPCSLPELALLPLDAFAFGCFLPPELLAVELSFELPLDAELSVDPDDPEFADLLASFESEGVELLEEAPELESADLGLEELPLSLGGGFEVVPLEFCELLWLEEAF